MRLLLATLFVAVMLGACASTTVNTEGTIVVEGTMGPTIGGGNCWVLESGTKVKEKTFYNLMGDPALLQKVHRDGARVSVRIRLMDAATNDCPVGTPAQLVEVQWVN
jgi:hypothetical protein